MPDGLCISSLLGLPLVKPGEDIVEIIIQALDRHNIQLQDKDILVITQKIISKAEDRYLRLRDVTPSEQALRLGHETLKDPRLVEVILSESTDVVRHRKGVLITAHRTGSVMANAGVDQSNVPQDENDDLVLMLPVSPDVSAQQIKDAFDSRFGVSIGIVINDSLGRPWRNGVVGVALGAAGIPSLRSLIGKPDLFGRKMRTTESAFADQVATAATLVMGESDEGIPAVHIRGLSWQEPERPAQDLVRAAHEDMFR